MEYGVDGMMVRTEKLDNGINVIMERIPYVKSVSIGVFIKVGSAYETKDTNGLSHVIEHMLFKRTSSRSSKDIADAIASLGGNLDAFTSKAVSYTHLDVYKRQREDIKKAINLINIIVTDYVEGEIYTGKVVSIKEFGAFLEFAPGKEGMVHISKLSDKRVNHVEDILTLGDVIKVKCLGKDKMGRVSFSLKDALKKESK